MELNIQNEIRKIQLSQQNISYFIRLFRRYLKSKVSEIERNFDADKCPLVKQENNMKKYNKNVIMICKYFF